MQGLPTSPEAYACTFRRRLRIRSMSKSGPGKSYRQGISWPELIQRFPDDAAAERWFEEQRWGQAGRPTHCPKCGSTERLS